MPNIAVIYKSNYGFTENYARWLAEDLGADLLTANQAKATDLQTYDTIIYGGGLYAGSVSGISFITKNYEHLKNKRLFIFTVGVADVTRQDNVDRIRSSLSRVLTPEMMQSTHIYHLKGGMKYSKMSLVHRGMMGMLIKMLRKKAADELSADDHIMIDTYGKDTDFTDRSAILAIVKDVKN